MLKDNKRVMNFKCLPDEEKPRERFIKYGKSNISNKELKVTQAKAGVSILDTENLDIDIFYR